MSLALTAAGNAIFAAGGLAVMLLAIWSRRHSHWARLFVRSAAVAGLAVTLRIGQWLLAIWTRTPPDAYADWHEATRAPVTTLASLLFVAGVTGMLWSVTRKGCWYHWMGVGAAWAAVAGGLGYFLTPA